MKPMKKFLAAVLAGMMVFSFASCSGSGDSTSSNGSSSTGSDTSTSSEANTSTSGGDGTTVDLGGAKITMSGSTSMEKFCSALTEAFNADCNAAASAEYTGSGAGIEAVTNGTVDIGNASRALTDEEKAGGLAENIVAIDGIAVVVDPNNSVSDLTTDQLTSIYKGEITNWSELGGEDQPIVVIGRESGSGTRSAFEELLAIEDACAYAQEIDSTGGVVAKVASTPGAIGYVSLDVLDDTVKAVNLDGVEPTEENIKAGTYSLSRPFVMATKGEVSEQSEAVQALFDYIESDKGQQIIEQVGLISAQ